MKTRTKLFYLAILLGALAFALMPVMVTGCASHTSEAKAFNSFRTTCDVTHSAYQAWCAKVVSGKVPPEREQQGDLAWNLFRSSFRRAFVAASQNWNAPVSTNVSLHKERFLNSIK